MDAVDCIRSAEEHLARAASERAGHPGLAALIDHAGAAAALRAMPAAVGKACPEEGRLPDIWGRLVARRLAPIPPTAQAVKTMRSTLVALEDARDATLAHGPNAAVPDGGAEARRVVDAVCDHIGYRVRLIPDEPPMFL